MLTEQAKRQNAERISGVPNVTFDLTAVLHNKLEAIAAYEVYKQDAREVGHHQAEAFFDQCQQVDRTAVQQLREMLVQNLSVGPPWATPTAGDVVVE
jgi:LmbE family N-acetylglucosaminyl deacetylase